MTRFFIDTSGRWSGGGTVVLRNLLDAARDNPILTADETPDSVAIIPRNVPAHWSTLRRPFIWMPQNALPWGPPDGSDRMLQLKLRMASRIVATRAHGMIRISPALPPLSRRPTSQVLHNVLDENFDHIIRDLHPEYSGSFVMLGSAHGYRNLDGLIDGYQRYRNEGGSTPLIIQMSNGSRKHAAMAVSRGSTVQGITIRCRAATRQDAANLMAGSVAILFTSSIEASPVTLLEAQALGKRIACSNISAHSEMAEGASTEFFDPSDAQAIADTLIKLDHSAAPPPRPLQEAAFRRAERERWNARLIAFLESLGVRNAQGPPDSRVGTGG